MKNFLALCVVLLLASCASIQYEGFSYTRIGNQELIDVTINMEKSPDGSMILESHLGQQVSEKELKEILTPMVLQMLQGYGLVP